ncbi:MAG: hypothetical protein ABFC80_05070 [Coriobacteriales bacterium]|nr:hypothetical protein [Actinomycetes bacterium]
MSYTAAVVEGYSDVAPQVRRDGGVTTVDARGVYYRRVNETVRQAISDGATHLVLTGVNGQRYIGTGVSAHGVRIDVHGTAGNDLGMLMDGPMIEVFGNAQDGVGNTMNAGTIVVHGDAGDVLGYGMRGGHVYIRGDVGYRVGIHMKAYENLVPVLVCGGKARDFFGEYMAGGIAVLLGMNTQFPEEPVAGSFLGAGMHGGVIYVRGTVEPWRCGKEVGIFEATEEDMATLVPLLRDYCSAMGMDFDEVTSQPFTRLAPFSHRPYGKLYVPL